MIAATAAGRMLTVLAAAFASTLAFAQAPAAAASADIVKRGEYLAIAGDCTACHSVPGGKPFGGGLAIPTPIGEIIATNITPSRSAGIGNYSLAQFDDALRRGVRADGAHLYPAMPYTSYALVTDDDVAALYAYFMNAVTPVDAAPPPTRLPFPFNVRLSMLAWNLLFLHDATFKRDPAKSDQWNRGAYLSRGLAHCSTCHSPRNLLMAEDASRDLGGGDVGTWFAPNVTSDVISGVGGWSEQELADYLRNGRTAGKGQASGPMAEAVDNSFRHMTDADLHAIATYVKSVPALRDTAETRPAYAWGAPADDLDTIRGVALPDDAEQMTGPQLYDANCATCHQARGQGSFDGGLPPLFHNTALGRADTNNLVMVILDGIVHNGEPAGVVMPAFRRDLSDQQVATLGNYLLQRFGNPDAKVAAGQVGKLRAGGGSTWIVWAVRAAMLAVVLLVVAALIGRGARRRRIRDT